MQLVENALWLLIRVECAAWRRQGHTPLIWWRDDDAREPTESLTHLLNLAENYDAPLALAVIPDRELGPLARALKGRAGLSVIQHGCDHQDRSRGKAPSSEFDPTETAATIAARINDSWRRLNEAVGATAVLAPPWNVLPANAREALLSTPIQAVSVYGAANDGKAGIREINTHIDIMKWRPAHFRGAITILTRLWRQLRSRRRARRWNEPIGILTHHKNLDPDAWAFLETLLAKLNSRRADFSWRSIEQLLHGQPDPHLTPNCGA